MEFLQYIIIIIFLVIVAFAIIKSKNKNFKLEANKLVEYLGGSDNIIEYFNKYKLIPDNIVNNVVDNVFRELAFIFDINLEISFDINSKGGGMPPRYPSPFFN